VPAPDEAALVSSGWIRTPFTSWDVRDGVVTPQDPACA
jgi:hypothetical protein